MTTQRMGNLEIAEAVAATWASRRAEIEEACAPVGAWLVRALAPREGETVLELAAGVGDTGFDAAGLVGERGRLICSDLSPGMLAAARRRADERGVGNVEYHVIDAERIDLPDDAVDGVLCRFAYMLMDDPESALSETRRVLRPGGRLAFAVWAAPEQTPFFTIILGGLVRGGHLPPPPPPPAPGVFGLADAGRIRALLAAAGFGDVRIDDVPVGFPLRDADAYIGLIQDTAGPLALALRALPAEDRAALREDVAAAMRPFAVGDGFRLPACARCVTAR